MHIFVVLIPRSPGVRNRNDKQEKMDRRVTFGSANQALVVVLILQSFLEINHHNSPDRERVLPFFFFECPLTS